MKIKFTALFICLCIISIPVFAEQLLQEYSSITKMHHFDANNGVYSNEEQSQDGSFVSKWQNLVSNNVNLTATNNDNQPLFLDSRHTGFPFLRFDGTNDNLSAAFDSPLTTPNTVFVVANVRSNIGEYIFDGNSSSGRHYLALGSMSSPSVWMYGAGKTTYSTPVRRNCFALHTIIFDGLQSKHFINGVLQKISDTGSGSFAGITVGSRYSSSNFNDMDIAELVIFSGAAHQDDRSNIETYLMDKYSLSPKCGDYRTSFPVADINQDCNVDVFDLSIMAQQWLNNNSNQTMDVIYPPLSPQSVDIFWQGMDGIHTYRIPSVVTTNNGVVLAFAEARKDDWRDKTPTKLVLRRSYSNGASWLATQTLVDIGDNAAMDPTAVVNKNTGRVILMYTVYPAGWNDNIKPGFGDDSCTIWTIYSDDDGQSWSQPSNITSQVKLEQWTSYNVGPGVGIQTATWPFSGRLIFSTGHGAVANDPASGNNHIVVSDDGGSTWRIEGYINSGSESQILELANGGLLMNIRGGGIRGRRISTSYDHGKTWSPITLDAELVEPVCQGSVLRLTKKQSGIGKNRVLFCNPGSAVERKNLTVRLSYDECQTWRIAKEITSNLASYSTLTVLKDNRIGVLYETGINYAAEKITFTYFSLDWLTDGADRL